MKTYAVTIIFRHSKTFAWTAQSPTIRLSGGFGKALQRAFEIACEKAGPFDVIQDIRVERRSK